MKHCIALHDKVKKVGVAENNGQTRERERDNGSSDEKGANDEPNKISKGGERGEGDVCL